MEQQLILICFTDPRTNHEQKNEEGCCMEGKCPVCGAPMEGDVCGYCGHKKEEVVRIQPSDALQGTSSQPQIATNNQNAVTDGVIAGVSKKSKTTALLLCIFLGGLGIHRFYVGKTGTGLLYMLSGGICGIGWIIDIILIATGNFKDTFDLPLRQ